MFGYVEQSKIQFDKDANITLTMGFNTHFKAGVSDIDHSEIVPAKGKILTIDEEKLIILFDISTLDKNVLKKYIYEREIELIAEFKELK